MEYPKIDTKRKFRLNSWVLPIRCISFWSSGVPFFSDMTGSSWDSLSRGWTTASGLKSDMLRDVCILVVSKEKTGKLDERKGFECKEPKHTVSIEGEKVKIGGGASPYGKEREIGTIIVHHGWLHL